MSAEKIVSKLLGGIYAWVGGVTALEVSRLGDTALLAARELDKQTTANYSDLHKRVYTGVTELHLAKREIAGLQLQLAGAVKASNNYGNLKHVHELQSLAKLGFIGSNLKPHCSHTDFQGQVAFHGGRWDTSPASDCGWEMDVYNQVTSMYYALVTANGQLESASKDYDENFTRCDLDWRRVVDNLKLEHSSNLLNQYTSLVQSIQSFQKENEDLREQLAKNKENTASLESALQVSEQRAAKIPSEFWGRESDSDAVCVWTDAYSRAFNNLQPKDGSIRWASIDKNGNWISDPSKISLLKRALAYLDTNPDSSPRLEAVEKENAELKSTVTMLQKACSDWRQAHDNAIKRVLKKNKEIEELKKPATRVYVAHQPGFTLYNDSPLAVQNAVKTVASERGYWHGLYVEQSVVSKELRAELGKIKGQLKTEELSRQYAVEEAKSLCHKLGTAETRLANVEAQRESWREAYCKLESEQQAHSNAVSELKCKLNNAEKSLAIAGEKLKRVPSNFFYRPHGTKAVCVWMTKNGETDYASMKDDETLFLTLREKIAVLEAAIKNMKDEFDDHN